MSGRPAVLVIAGSDSSGGAGIVRDLNVLADLGIEALCAITAVTAQTHGHVVSVHHVPPEIVRTQIRAALDSSVLGAIKIGMLGTAATVSAVADCLPRGGGDSGRSRPGAAFLIRRSVARCGGASGDARAAVSARDRPDSQYPGSRESLRHGARNEP